jgi:soluble lytic murein transglycosylase-like protein
MRGGLRALVAAGAAAVLLTGCGGPAPGDLRAGDVTTQQSEAAPTAGPAADPAEAADAGIGRGPTPAPAPKRTTATRKPHPKPTRKATTETKLPPAPPKPKPNCKPTYKGTQATRAEAKAALTEAAGRTYWPTSAPSIKVPLELVKATAWQESGWQSNIVACDGGVGLMQVMPGTRDYVNMRFDQNYDIGAYRDNALLGANYQAWLIKYFGDVYFDHDYSVDAADCADAADLCLLNAVIAAYNVGFGAVDTDAGLVIPNKQYVQNVRALMTDCECLSF